MLKRPFVGIFIVFFIIGCFSVMKENTSFITEKQAKGQIEGVVFDIVEKTNTTQLHLKDCIFREDVDGKIYKVGNILVTYSKKSSQKQNQSECIQIETIQIGNKIKVNGSLESFQLPRNPGQFNERFYYQSRNYYYKFWGEEIVILDNSVSIISEILRTVREKLALVYDNHLPSKEAGVVKAMVLGEKSGLLEEIKTLYQQNGIGHLMAISGLHISLLGMGFYRILQKIGSPKKVSSILAIIFIWLYGLMTGFSISTNRAVVMLMISLIAGIVGRTYDMPTALAISGCIILLQKPMLCLDCGFLLSFGSIVGIGFFYPLLEEITGLKVARNMEKNTFLNSRKNSIINKIIGSILKSLLASLSVQFVTLPIILYFYFEIPVYGVFLNIVVIPLMSILLGVSLIGGIVGLLFSNISFLPRFFLGSAYFILNFYEKCGELCSFLPYSRVIIGKPEVWQIIIYYSVLALIGRLFYFVVYEENKIGKLIARKEKKNKGWLVDFLFVKCFLQKGEKRYKKTIICLLLMFSITFLLIPANNWNIKSLEITFLDVGQGDGIFIKNGKGMTVLIDGGSTDEKSVGTYRIIPFLKSKGVGILDYIIVTHADSDHMNGILELLEKRKESGIKINHLLLPKTTLIEENYEKLVNLAEENKIPILYIKAGDKFKEGSFEMTCLHPTMNFTPDNTNSYSTVLQLEYGNFKALFTGDLEKNGEDVLLEHGELEDIFLLKVAHHGSKYSTKEEFLNIVNPEISIISSGKDNSYGHPHKELLERLENVGSKIMSTTEYGGITVEVEEGGKVRVDGYVR